MSTELFRPDPGTLPQALERAQRELPRWRGLTQLWVVERFDEPVEGADLDNLVEAALQSLERARNPSDFRPRDSGPKSLQACRRRYLERLLRLHGIASRHLHRALAFLLERGSAYIDGTTLGLLVDHDAADVTLRKQVAWAIIHEEALGSPPSPRYMNQLLTREGFRKAAEVRAVLLESEQRSIVEPLLRDNLKDDRRACFQRFAEIAPEKALEVVEEDLRDCKQWLGPTDIMPLLQAEDADRRMRAMSVLPELRGEREKGVGGA